MHGSVVNDVRMAVQTMDQLVLVTGWAHSPSIGMATAVRVTDWNHLVVGVTAIGQLVLVSRMSLASSSTNNLSPFSLQVGIMIHA